MALSTNKLPIFQPGVPMSEQLTAVNLNLIVQAIEQLRPLTGTGMYMKRVPGGMVYDVRRTFQNVGRPFPWELLDFSNPDDGPRFRVRPGSVNGIIPTNIFDFFEFDPDATQWIVNTVTTNTEAVTSSLLSVETDPPDGIGSTAGAAPSSFQDVIGMIDEGALYQVRASNLVASVVQTIQEDKSSPTPGTLTYIPHYTWSVQ